MNYCYSCKYGKEISEEGEYRCIHPAPDVCEIVYVVERKFKIQKLYKGRKIYTDKNSSMFINEFFVWPIHFDPIMIEQCKGFKIKELS